MQTFRFTAKKYSCGYFIRYTGTSRHVATFRKFYPDRVGSLELNDGTMIYDVKSLAHAKQLLTERIHSLP